MLNNLPLIIVMILSLFLAFYCVDSHKDNIVSMVNMDEKNIEPATIKREENSSTSQMEIVESVEQVYVEELAVEDTNKSSKIVEKTEEKSLSEVVVEDSKPTEVEVKVDEQVIVDVKEVEVEVIVPTIEPEIESMPVIEMKPEEVKEEEIDKTVNEQVTSEYSEGYKLDDLEKMIMEELKKGNKD